MGYLVLENGIFIFGMLLVQAMPLVVELGVLLDLFVARIGGWRRHCCGKAGCTPDESADDA